MSDRDLVRMVEDDREGDVLREDLERASTHSTEYDVAAGVAAFEASLASAPPPGAESASVTGVTAAGTGAGKIVMVVLGVVAVAGVAGLALSGSGDPTQPDTPTAVAVESPEQGSPEPKSAGSEAANPELSEDAHQAAAVAEPVEDSSADLAVVPELSEASDAAPAQVPARRRPAAQPSKPPASAPGVDGLKAEMSATDRARKALAGNPGRALTLARQANAEFPQGLFAEQRAGIEALALIALGKDTAHRTAERYLRKNPKGTYADRIRDALADNP